MKKVRNLILVFLMGMALFLPQSHNVSAQTSTHRIYGKNYDVSMHVLESGLVDVHVTLDLYFNSEMQGIYVEIPTRYQDYDFSGFTHNEEDRSKSYHFPIYNFKSLTHEYESDSTNSYGAVYRMGSEGVYLKGDQTFEYTYQLQLKDLRLSGNEQLFFMNLMGDRWEFPFNAVSFSVSFDKDISGSPVEVQAGKNNTIVDYTLESNRVFGQFDQTLMPGEGLTVVVDVPDHYFTFANYDYTFYTLLVSAGVLIVVAILFYRYGKDTPIVDSVEFTAPDGFNSAEVAYIYKGSMSVNDITSLIIYWASQGYLIIEELDDDEIKLKKRKDFNKNHGDEKRLFDALFDDRDEVLMKDLENNFYRNIQFAQTAMTKSFHKKERRIFDPMSIFIQVIAGLLILIPVSLFVAVARYNVYSRVVMNIPVFFVVFSVMLMITIFSIITVMAYRRVKRIFRPWVILSFVILYGVVAIALCIFSYLYSVSYLYAIIIATLYMISLFYAAQMGKRTPQGSRWYGQILGLKRFIETAELGRLEALALETPSIFYDILPFAYVLGISKVWSEKFESIAMEKPDWYQSTSVRHFNTMYFYTSMNRSMLSMSSAMVSIPESKGSSGGGFGGFSGGGSSGGGFSGGGFGGGGGGGW